MPLLAFQSDNTAENRCYDQAHDINQFAYNPVHRQGFSLPSFK
jgi:hypothetical protein